MTEPTLDTKVRDFLAQKRIAVAGVSREGAGRSSANAIHRRLKAAGHEVFAVNPNAQTFDDRPCWPAVGSIPGGVDAVVIVTRPEITEQIVRDCVAAGVRRVWMHASGARGSSVSADAVAFARQNAITVIAGACPMMYGPGVDFGHRCMRLMMRLSGDLPA